MNKPAGWPDGPAPCLPRGPRRVREGTHLSRPPARQAREAGPAGQGRPLLLRPHQHGDEWRRCRRGADGGGRANGRRRRCRRFHSAAVRDEQSLVRRQGWRCHGPWWLFACTAVPAGPWNGSVPSLTCSSPSSATAEHACVLKLGASLRRYSASGSRDGATRGERAQLGSLPFAPPAAARGPARVLPAPPELQLAGPAGSTGTVSTSQILPVASTAAAKTTAAGGAEGGSRRGMGTGIVGRLGFWSTPDYGFLRSDVIICSCSPPRQAATAAGAAASPASLLPSEATRWGRSTVHIHLPHHRRRHGGPGICR